MSGISKLKTTAPTWDESKQPGSFPAWFDRMQKFAATHPGGKTLAVVVAQKTGTTSYHQQNTPSWMATDPDLQRLLVSEPAAVSGAETAADSSIGEGGEGKGEAGAGSSSTAPGGSSGDKPAGSTTGPGSDPGMATPSKSLKDFLLKPVEKTEAAIILPTGAKLGKTDVHQAVGCRKVKRKLMTN